VPSSPSREAPDAPSSTAVGGAFDSFLSDEGLLQQCTAAAEERVARWRRENPAAPVLTLEDLLAESNFGLLPSPDERAWLDGPAVGREIF
jgi:hypothetical protein